LLNHLLHHPGNRPVSSEASIGETNLGSDIFGGSAPLKIIRAVTGCKKAKADMFTEAFVRKFFPDDMTSYYAAAGTIGRALVYFTAPLISRR
jgi:hypothetical protein